MLKATLAEFILSPAVAEARSATAACRYDTKPLTIPTRAMPLRVLYGL
jgi:hypothetical protein